MGVQDLKNLPSVDQVLSREEVAPLLATYPRKIVQLCVNDILEEMRGEIAGTSDDVPEREELTMTLLGRLESVLERRTSSTLRRVVNATGTIIHTNLGRSLLAPTVVESLVRAATGYTPLEYDLERGKRGSRYVHCAGILRELTGCEEALVVNNNAAAVLLSLNTLSFGKEAVVSRGELVEIGGSFRMPEVMEKSGAVMVEVGSTNRTRIADYERAIGENTALLVKVHPSNFAMVGFVEEVPLPDLVALGRSHGIPVLHDMGSGLLADLRDRGLTGEPVVAQSLEAGVDVVTFSGDKLLGGPQAGIILGKKDVLDRIRTNPMTRALRVDKLTIAALEATLMLYYDPERVRSEIPTLSMITADLETLKARAKRITDGLGKAVSGSVRVRDGRAAIGGGSFPGVTVPSIELWVEAGGMTANELELRGRRNDPPVLGRIQNDTFILNLAAVRDDDIVHVIAFIEGALGS